MNTVVFAGAGVSAELGVPAMRPMSLRFRDHLRDSGYSARTVDTLTHLLEASDYDMEGVIDDLDSASRGAAAGVRWGITDTPALPELESIRAEAEWLVSHLCERVDARRAFWLWAPILRRATGTLTLVTTNYDRAIEQAALQTGTHLADGFPEFEGAEVVSWVGFDGDTRVRILKIHGSTDWYHEADSSAVWKLRHAMPLYGHVRVSTQAAPEIQLTSALVLPSREKNINRPPYPTLQYEFRKAVESSDLVAIVGSSLRDPDLADIARWSAERRPTLVVNRRPGQGTPGTPIQMSASRFLVSVLPRAMTASTGEEAAALALTEEGRTAEILDAISMALEPNSPTDERCDAIEQLAKERVSLGGGDLGPLLRDSSTQVATYALGLIRDSAEVERMTAVAIQRAESDPASPFAREARLLSQIA